MTENKLKKLSEMEKRLEEVEDWLLENSFLHPDFSKYVDERNQLTTQLNLI